jgi:hypothetical protein
MKMKTYFSVTLGGGLCLALSLPVTTVMADHMKEDQHEHREHGAHEHGVAQLNVGLENGILQIDLETPAMNIVGFEHAAASAQEHQQLQEAVAILRAADRVFAIPPAAGCAVQEVTVESSLLAKEAHKHSEARSDTHEEHADFDVSYRYACKNTKALSHLDVQLFSLFPGMHEIAVQLITENRQGAQELGPQSVRLRLQ